MFNLCRNKIGPAELHDFIRYIPDEEYNKIVEETSMSISRVDVWICICVKLLFVKDYRGGDRQKELKKCFRSM